MKKNTRQQKALDLLKQLENALNSEPNKQNKLARQLEKTLIFKDKEIKEKWLDLLFSFRCWEDFEELTKTIINDMREDMDKALLELKNLMKKVKDKRVYARVTNVARSGMSRSITFRVITKKGELLRIDGIIQRITQYRWAREWCDGIIVSGCGMDVIFNTLYNINSVALYRNIIKPSKKHNEHDLRYSGIVNTNYWTL